MAPLRTAATACGLLLAFALLTYTGNASAAQLGGRRSLQTWVPESGSFTLETGLVHPNPVKSKSRHIISCHGSESLEYAILAAVIRQDGSMFCSSQQHLLQQ